VVRDFIVFLWDDDIDSINVWVFFIIIRRIFLDDIKVFVSYSWDSDEHKDNVRDFTDRLNSIDNIDADLDQYKHKSPPEGWTGWMENKFTESKYIVIVWTEIYSTRYTGKEIEGRGLGVKNEALLTRTYLSKNNSMNDKIISVVLKAEDKQYIASPYHDYTCYDLSTDDGYGDLIRDITDNPKYTKPNRSKNITNHDNPSTYGRVNKSTVHKWDLHRETRNDPKVLSCILSERKPRSEKHKNILEKNLDQKDLYTSHESVEKWGEWEKGSEASSGKKGISAFQKFLGKDPWKNKVNKIDTVIDLGVGSGVKTSDIMHSFRKANISSDKIDLVIVDESEYMLHNASTSIFTSLHEEKYYISINGLNKDFMDLSKSKNAFQGSRALQSAFFLLGGTFGNINEDNFIKSLTSVMNPGDYFILGVFLEGDNENESEKYDNETIENMFSPSLRDLGFNLIEDEESNKVTRGAWKNYGVEGNQSCVPGSTSMQFYANIKDTYNDILIQEIKESLESNNSDINNDDIFNELDTVAKKFKDKQLKNEIEKIKIKVNSIVNLKDEIASIVKDYIGDIINIELFHTTRYSKIDLNKYMESKGFVNFETYVEGSIAYMAYEFEG